MSTKEELWHALMRRGDSEVASTAMALRELYEIEILERDAKIAALEEKVKSLHQQFFGQKKDKAPKAPSKCEPGDHKGSDPGADEAGCNRAVDAMRSGPENTSEGRKATTLPEHLERVDEMIEPDSIICSCGCNMRIIGEDVQERLGVRVDYYVIRERYPKYACPNCEEFRQAEAKRRLQDGCTFSHEMLAGLIIDKFADGLPFHRQCARLERKGIKMHRSTLARWCNNASHKALRPVFEALLQNIRENSEMLQMDETPIRMLEPGTGKTATCYAWALKRDDRAWRGNQPPAVAFHFATSRAGENADYLLGDYSRGLQVDGYAGYNRLRDRMNLAFCWAHARRKFVDVLKTTGSPVASASKDLVDQVYDIEREVRGKSAPVRQQIRSLRSRPLLDAFFAKIERDLPTISQGSTHAKAIKYALKLRDGLEKFLDDGRIEADTNLVENEMRPLAIVRKAALFAGNKRGGEAWMINASLIGTCRLSGVDPNAYFLWLFDKIANRHPRAHYDELLPWHFPGARFD